MGTERSQGGTVTQVTSVCPLFSCEALPPARVVSFNCQTAVNPGVTHSGCFTLFSGHCCSQPQTGHFQPGVFPLLSSAIFEKTEQGS